MVPTERSIKEKLECLQERVDRDPTATSPDEIATVVVEAQTASEATESVLPSAIEADPDLAERIVEAIVPSLRDGDHKTRHNACVALIRIGELRPDAVGPAVPILVKHLEDDANSVRDRAALALATVAFQFSSEVVGAVPSLESLFESEFLYRRARGAVIAAAIAQSDSNALIPLADTIVNAVLHETTTNGQGPQSEFSNGMIQEEFSRNSAASLRQSERMRRNAGRALMALSTEHPEVIASHFEELQEGLLDEENPHKRAIVTIIFATVAERRPTLVDPYIDHLCEVLATADDPFTSGTAARTLGLLAEERPEKITAVVRPHLKRIGTLLKEDEAHIRASAAGLLSHISEVNPGLVRPYVSILMNLLDDDTMIVRGNAVTALGFINDEDVRRRLVQFSETEPDEEVRTVATNIVESFESRSRK